MGRTTGTITPPALVAAVSEAGGLGCLGATGLEPDEIGSAIKDIRSRTDRPFAVGLLFAGREAPPEREAVRAEIRRNHPRHWKLALALHERFGLKPAPLERRTSLSAEYVSRQVEAIVEARVPVMSAGLGEVGTAIRDLHAVGTKVIGLSGSVRQALRQRESGADVVVAQGYEAGGHTGLIATIALIPQVVDALPGVPVVAAGGVGDGRTLAAALALGAQGAWCGSAFLFATEATMYDQHRVALMKAASEDMIVSRAYTGKPSRILQNAVLQAWSESGLDPLPMPHQMVLMEDFVHAAQLAGRQELINNPGGQVVGLLSETRPAAEIVRSMAEQAAAVIAGLPGRR